MKKAGLIAVFFLLVLAQPAIARSGCCSHHGGVMANGCGCNDGTPLSSTCASYYVCTANEPVYNTTQPENNPPTLIKRGTTPYPIVPTNTPSSTPTSIPTPTPTVAPTFTPTPTTTTVPTPFEVSKEVKGTEDRKKKTFFDYFFNASLGRILFPQFGFLSLFEN